MIEDYSIETVLIDGNPVQSFKHRFKSVPALFGKAVETYRERPFLFEGEKGLTFLETQNRIFRISAFLKNEYGLRKGSHVGLLMENSNNFVLVFLAIQQLGATAIVFNHHLTGTELERQMEVSDLDLMVFSPAFSAKMEEVRSEKKPSRTLLFSPDQAAALPLTVVPPDPPDIDEEDTAVILFTSGTTGLPKGTMITHRNLITSACKQGYYSEKEIPLKDPSHSKTLLVAPLFHVLALQEQLFPAIFSGTTMYMMPVLLPEPLLELIVREKINILTGTPTLFWILLHKTPIQNYDLRCVEVIKYGGAPMPPDLLRDIKKIFPEVRLVNGYGLTEASVITLLLDQYVEQKPTSVGRPALCSEVKFVDPFGKEVNPHEIGELAVRGGPVTRGYYKLPEETRKAYREGWFFTGDMGFQDEEGFITLVGRSKEMINRGGEKVYPVEVENILHLHPRILDVSVLGLPDPVMGEIVACAVILRPGSEALDLTELQDFCRSQLAYYKIPQRMFLLSELPKNPGGKVMKKKLLEQIQTTS
ncbi:MAG: class I adenylate-forming enzyme family protein [Thermodesulfobacteriota bacterium]